MYKGTICRTVSLGRNGSDSMMVMLASCFMIFPRLHVAHSVSYDKVMERDGDLGFADSHNEEALASMMSPLHIH